MIGGITIKVGIIDADIIGRKNTGSPNLACMKLSSYYKSNGNDVVLLTNYDSLDKYDKVFISKVFTSTEVPEGVLNRDNGVWRNGVFLRQSSPLPQEIEHIMPDYHLYDEWVAGCINNGAKSSEFTYYTDYSIGFLTRGCFRQCSFCVNKKLQNVQDTASMSLWTSRKKLCFLDDNFFVNP